MLWEQWHYMLMRQLLQGDILVMHGKEFTTVLMILLSMFYCNVHT